MRPEINFNYKKALRILAFICVPTLSAFVLVRDGTSEADIFIFLVVSILNALLFPRLSSGRVSFLFGPLDRDHVDFFYYSLGMIGVGLFFLSENISTYEVDLRERHARLTAIVEDLSDYADNPRSLFSQAPVRDDLQEQIILGLDRYLENVEANRSECSPSNWDKYDFCETEKRLYKTAQSAVSSGTLRASRARTCCYFSEEFERVLDSIPVRVHIPSTVGRDANGVRLQSVLAAEYLFTFPFDVDGTQEQMASFEEALRSRLSRVRGVFERNKRKLDLETEFGAVSRVRIWASNIWPFILILALSTKIGRDRWSFCDKRRTD
ncbi:hypothetical protein K3740_00635 [Ruegeria conchae]|uniref:hypothetical protein n=1 Tax=Ruegeria conchae TaxID=981384 RepID=UPI0021A94E15|nr:hypothetical protein [Ruegeria conchae]UWR03253.1 hypothetical protein K3740_00635 [Ruegeria conchae]